MGFVSWIVAGLVLGLLAKIVSGLRGAADWLASPAIGIAGALLGGLIYSLFAWGSLQQFRIGSLVLAVIISVVFLIAYRVGSRQPRWS